MKGPVLLVSSGIVGSAAGRDHRPGRQKDDDRLVGVAVVVRLVAREQGVHVAPDDGDGAPVQRTLRRRRAGRQIVVRPPPSRRRRRRRSSRRARCLSRRRGAAPVAGPAVGRLPSREPASREAREPEGRRVLALPCGRPREEDLGEQRRVDAQDPAVAVGRLPEREACALQGLAPRGDRERVDVEGDRPGPGTRVSRRRGSPREPGRRSPRVGPARAQGRPRRPGRPAGRGGACDAESTGARTAVHPAARDARRERTRSLHRVLRYAASAARSSAGSAAVWPIWLSGSASRASSVG